MSQPELDLSPKTFNIIMADASNLPVQHVNALAIRSSSDEFFVTLGIVIPPDQSEVETAVNTGHLVADPVFRFAISRDTMAKFLGIMAVQYDQQTMLINQMQHPNKQINQEEANKNE